MMLNRVLLGSAAASMMVSAMVFTISCSGDDGKAGAVGTSCTVQATDNGYDVLCGTDKVGTLSNGAAGAKGDDGESCELGPKAGGSYQVICGGETQGTLDVCSATTNATSGQVTITCGSSVVNLCGGQVLANNEICRINGGNASSTGGTAFTNPCGDGTTGVHEKQYCGFKDANATRTTVLPLCASTGDPYHDSLKINNPNGTAWTDEYCEIIRVVTTLDNGEKETHDSTATAEPSLCGTSKVKLNNGSWKGEYCGFASATAVNATVIATGICDDGNGPNKDQFNGGYCTVTFENKKNGITSYTNIFCSNTSSRDAGARMNENTWKKQYCGSDANSRDKLENNMCDDGGMPNSPYLAGYCQIASRTADSTFLQTAWCGGTNGSYGDNNKINENKWSSEYCGVAPDNTTPMKYTGACDIYSDQPMGPNSITNASGYCMANENGITSRSTTFCDPTTKTTTNNITWKGEYCFSDNKVLACTGGTIGDLSKASGDPVSERCQYN